MQFSDLDLNKTYTYADYLKWTFDERLELIKGKIFPMSPAPAEIHQRISTVVANELYNNLKGKPCRVYSAPFDVRLMRKSKKDKEIATVLQPDICVICDLNNIDDRGCIGAPDIVVEILSPGNNKKELQNKYEVYEEAGVKEYWIINPYGKTFLKYILDENGQFQSTKLLTLGDEVTSSILPKFTLNLDEVFAD
ncbi:Uma2 family endonuclease [uncultured Mucilaginibacter sp.]|uniref:Uma2 family endonuclease n=1 Tax=uncultured Mucilaginibacter sp. TaxID=797541 RepID=UPI002609241E|nr:Uma2 family endonuclease [uncultured Mucilaginibacter sp.]